MRAKGDFAKKVRKALNEAGWAAAHPGPFYMVGGTWRALAAYAMRAADYPLTDPHGFELDAAEAEHLARKLTRSKPEKLAANSRNQHNARGKAARRRGAVAGPVGGNDAGAARLLELGPARGIAFPAA